MLVELHIKNLAVIKELLLPFGSGLTVLSGDEGVGKSLIIDALLLLLGERCSTSLIRDKAGSALVEGVFEVKPDSELKAILVEAGLDLENDGNLILTRELQAQGRSVARVNGRAVPISLLRELGQRLIDIHRQMENISILNQRRQMDLLDGFSNLLEHRHLLGKKVAELKDKEHELTTLTGQDQERRRDLLQYQVAEIEDAKIKLDEEETLQQEVNILRRIEALRERCYVAYGRTYFDEQSATGLLHQATRALHDAANIDPSLSKYIEIIESASLDIEEAARDLRHYTDNLEISPDRLAEVEGRLRLLNELKHKYGGSLGKIMEFANSAKRELETLQNLDERKQHLEDEKRRLEEEVSKLAQKLSEERQKAARSLTERVNAELGELGVPWAKFEIGLRRDEDPNGLSIMGKRYSYNQDGIDKVDFLGTTNPGVPLMPLADIASGGETCRFMLALKSALQQVDRVPTLVFDEIDSGIGGRSAQVIGKKLVGLAQDRQVIAITHLPQIACFGHCHYHVTKEIARGQAFTRVESVEGESRVEELAAMLGSRTNHSMRDTAQELINEAIISQKN